MAEAKKSADSGEREVQAKVDEVEERGFLGEQVDDRPREDYTLAGAARRRGENLEN